MKAIAFDSSGNKWVATGGGVSKYTGTSWTKWTTGNSALASNSCLGIAAEGTTIWVGTLDRGVCKFNGTSWTTYNTTNGLPNVCVNGVAVDSLNNKWFATLAGVSKYDGTTFTNYTNTAFFGGTDDIYAAAIAPNGDKWFATLKSVTKFNGTTWTVYTSSQGVANNDNRSIAIAPDGTVWAGSNGSGASKFASSSWTVYNSTNSGLANNTVNAVAVESNTLVWFGTIAGVSKLNTGVSPPVANFVGSPTSGNAPLTVNFTDQSTGSPTAWSWTFGDSGTSTAQNPSHQYTSTGTYTVSLTASNAGGSNTNTKTNYIVVTTGTPPPTANFTGSPLSGNAPLTVAFTDTSTGSPTAWSWTFGDSGTSTAQNPSHQYTAAGTYTVALTASNAGGSNTNTKTNYITVAASVPVPDFDANPASGLAPLNVAFTDRSTGDIDTWKYDFDGNGGFEWSDSSGGNTSWTYLNTGVYTVCLKVRDNITNIYYNCIKTNLISVTSPTPPAADFTANKTSGSVPLTIQFTDTSTGDNINSWSWTFGDTGTSTARNPSYVYNSQGVYTVALTASSAYGTDTETKTNYITVNPAQPCVADFSGNPTAGFAALQVQFSDLSSGSVTSWNWTFGDSGTSTQANPAHTYNMPGVYSVGLAVSGPLNSDSITKTNYITVQEPPTGGSGFAFPDTAADLDNLHPHLIMKGYGTENGLWAKAQTTHSEIWARLTSTAPTGATFYGISRNMTSQQSVIAYLISKINGYGQYCQDMVQSCMTYNWIVGGDDAGIASMETFWGYCMAYDAIVDDPAHGGPTWLSSSDKSTVLANIAEFVQELNYETGDTWRLRPTHNFMVCRAADHAAGLYNLRGEPGYESIFNTSREYDLIYHNERINGLCNNGVLGTIAPLSNNGPRPADGFPYEGPSYGAYQGSRALVHRYIMELNEYPNPATVLDENKSGFAQNFVLAWMAVAPPGLGEWADVAYNGDHGVVQAMRFHSAINKAVGVSDTCKIPAGKMAGVAEWFTRTLIPLPKGDPDAWWWQGFEYIWYDASIEPMTPAEAGLPLYIHLDDAEFHMYRSDWNLASNSGTYVYTRNSGHDAHTYWSEKHSGSDVPGNCQVQTSSHDGADNGHYGIYRAGDWIAWNASPQGNTDMHNCLLIDGLGGAMDDIRGYQAYALANADCIGAVDSDYGNVLDEVLGGIYSTITTGNDGYHRYLLVLRDPMYVLVADEVESGHSISSRFHSEPPLTKVSDSLYTSNLSRDELLYPASGFTAVGLDPLSITTTNQRLLWMVHANPSGVSFSKSYPGNLCVATIGSDTVIYNPTGGTYSQSGISGNAKFFAQRTGGAIIVKATSATGSQYGASCAAAVNLSVKGRKASIYVYGTGSQTVTVTSPYGTDTFANVSAGQTVAKVLTGRSVAPPVADFTAIPTTGWNAYVAPEFISFSTGWITDYLWEFGDGEWSTELAPHHKYVSAGIYTIKLTVAGPGGSNSMTKSNFITINDFGNYNWPDYVLTQPDFAAFTSALTSIEASQTQFYTEKPEWCHNGSWTPWCDVVSTLQGHGGGGRILFGFSNTTIYGNWDGRVDPIKTWGDSNNKYDWVGDQLIIDGEDKNIGFYYNGTLNCGQAENQQAFRIHGCDNIVRNIRWERFPDGIHMRHGMRMLFEGITNMVVCEDTVSMNGVGGSCMYCTQRNGTFGSSADKTQMYSTADGYRSLGPGIAVICGMHSTNGNQPIRMTSSNSGTQSMLIVRNSIFEGDSQGVRLGGKEGAVAIFENNYGTETKNGSCGGIRIGEGIHAIIRNNIFENSTAFGMYFYTTGAFVHVQGNLIKNNGADGVNTDVSDPCDTHIDLGGGSPMNPWQYVPAAIRTLYGIGPGAVATSSCGQNTFQGNVGRDVVNALTGTPQPVLKAENNFWDHSTVAEVQSLDVTGNVDVDPLGINPNNP